MLSAGLPAAIRFDVYIDVHIDVHIDVDVDVGIEVDVNFGTTVDRHPRGDSADPRSAIDFHFKLPRSRRRD